MQIFRVHIQKTTLYKCDHAGQLPESDVSSVDMLTLSVYEMEIFIFSYEKEGKPAKYH